MVEESRPEESKDTASLCAVCCVLLIVYCISCVFIVAIPPFAAAEKVPCQGVLVAEEGEEEVYTSLGLD